MTGATGVCGNAFSCAEATLEFCQALQFSVAFAEPHQTGKLIINAKANGLLRAPGKHSIVGMTEATTTLHCGPNLVATVPLNERTTGSCSALTASVQPVEIPVGPGQFELRQQFRITTFQKNGLCVYKASADFSPSAMPEEWVTTADPFRGVDKEHLGYEVLLQVVTDSAVVDEIAPGLGPPLTRLPRVEPSCKHGAESEHRAVGRDVIPEFSLPPTLAAPLSSLSIRQTPSWSWLVEAMRTSLQARK